MFFFQLRVRFLYELGVVGFLIAEQRLDDGKDFDEELEFWGQDFDHFLEEIHGFPPEQFIGMNPLFEHSLL